MILRVTALLAVTLAGATACNRDQPPADDSGDGESTMPAMPAMETGQSGAMMQEMMTHLERMQRLDADSLPAVLQMHRQQVANMIAQMNREMRDMAMPADASWNAVLDSLRGDLTRMPEMSETELQQLMPRHAGRVERLMDMHRRMMSTMQR